MMYEALPSTVHCGLCREPLLRPSEDPSETAYVDDVEFPCHTTSGSPEHHFHWDCLIQANEGGAWDGRTCPFLGCEVNPLNDSGRLIVKVVNEGGVVEGFDLTEVLEDETGADGLPLARRREIALFQAALEGDLEDVEELLDLGVDPNSIFSDNTGLTPLHAAAMMQDDTGFELCETLMRKGANPHIQTLDGYTALDAAQVSRSQRVHALLLQWSSSAA